VRQALTQRFGATLNVRSVDTEARLLSNAAKPEAQLTALFSAISLVVGVILAYNALLLASGERRAFIAYLVKLGTPDGAIIASLIFDALILGVAGSILGLLVGDAISLLAYRAPPGYLTAAFPIGGQRIVGLQTILVAFAAGMFAAFAAAALPAVAILRSRAIEPEAGPVLSLLRRPRLSDSIAFACGTLLMFASIAASLLWPAVIVIALLVFASGLVLCLPMTVRYTLGLAGAWARRVSDPSARLASGELKTSPTRSIALVATGTIAVFLMMTIGGSVADVQRAVSLGAKQTGSGADLWIKPGGAENIYGTQPFEYAVTQRRLQRMPDVRSVLACLPTILLGSPRPPNMGHRHSSTGGQPNRGKPTRERPCGPCRTTLAHRGVGRDQPNNRKPTSLAARRVVHSANAVRKFKFSPCRHDLKLRMATRHGPPEC
jgi:putative ABC transport system permease protein